MRVSMNVGLTASQLRQLTQVLADRVDADNARRACEALERHWPPNPEAEVSAPVEL
jgi:4-carboxymuconolactone decarboxylase